MKTALLIMFCFIAAKSFTIGSPFNFYKWFKHGRKYLDEYNEWAKKAP
jgi:hypothetical protein